VPVQLEVEERRRTAILDAAGRLIAERGYHAVRIADIARLVGTSTGAVHYYFPGKNDVLTAALSQQPVDRAFERQSAELTRIDDAHQRLLKLIDMQLPTVGRVRDEWSVWMQFWAEATIHPSCARCTTVSTRAGRRPWRGIVLRGQRQGVFRADADVGRSDPPADRAHRRRGDQVLTGRPG